MSLPEEVVQIPITRFGDYRVFTKVFKKAEGITPSQYRRDFLEETGKTDT